MYNIVGWVMEFLTRGYKNQLNFIIKINYILKFWLIFVGPTPRHTVGQDHQKCKVTSYQGKKKKGLILVVLLWKNNKKRVNI